MPEDRKDNPNGIAGESLKLQDIENFFYYTINPHLIETKIEKESMALAKERGGINPQMIILLVLVLIGGAVAYSIVASSMSSSEITNKYVTCQTSLAKCTQPVVSNPAVTGTAASSIT